VTAISLQKTTNRPFTFRKSIKVNDSYVLHRDPIAGNPCGNLFGERGPCPTERSSDTSHTDVGYKRDRGFLATQA
jgi:hypothetical protein